MRHHRYVVQAALCVCLLFASTLSVARVPVYFYAVANWYTDGSDNYYQSATKLLAHQYPDAYSAFATEWNQHVPQCDNGGGPQYILESVEPVASDGYADGDLYDAYYRSLASDSCGEPSQSHSHYGDGAQLYYTCGGGDVTEHDARSPSSCPQRAIDPEKNRGNPPPDCPCDGGKGSGNKPVSDPVNPGTGNKFDILTLYRGQGSFPLDLVLSFNSMTGTSTALDRPHQVIGRQRIHSYMRRIRVSTYNSASTAYVLRADGKTYTFDRQGNSWLADADIADRLTATYDGSGNVTAWTYVTSDNDTEQYDASGNLLTILHEGWTQKLTYDASGRLAQVEDAQGRTLSFGYDTNGHLQTVNTPDGAIQLTYDSVENVSRVTWPDNTHRDYLYAEPYAGHNLMTHNLTGVIDENGTRIDNTTYDDYEHTLSDYGPAGTGTTSVAYSSSPEGYARTTITHPLGHTEQVDYASQFGVPHAVRRTVSCNGCTTQTTTYTYDATGHLATRHEPNGTTTLTTYDSTGLLLSVVRASGTDIQTTITRTWDPALRKLTKEVVSDAGGTPVSIRAWTYNAQGQTTAECLIDPNQASSYACSPTGTAPAGVRRTVTTYCSSVSATCPLIGLVLSADGPRTDVSDTETYSWYTSTDESGCGAVGGACHRIGDLRSVTDAAGLVTIYASYDKAGRPARVKAPNGVFSDYTYTQRGWLATTTVRAQASGAPSSSDAVTTVAYNPDGTVHQVTDPDKVITTYTYDAAHRLTDVTDGQGRRYHYTLDVAGNRTKEQVITAAGTVVRTTSQSFNALAQLTAITDGLNRTVFSAAYADSYDASSNLVHSQDGLGVQRKQVFDGLNRLVSTLRNYQGTDTGTKDAQSVTSFDALDRVTGFSDPDGLNTTYDIDALGNVTGLHSPDTGTTARTFDAAGNLTTSTDATSNSSTSTYDVNNRILSTSYSDTTLNVQYKYDEADSVTGCTGSFGKGKLTRIIEANGGIVFCYDARGNVVRKQQKVGTMTTTTAYTWTRGDRLNSVTTPNGTLISYSRDSIGNVTAMTATPQGGTATTIVSNVVYRSFGPVASYKLGDGQTVTITHDASGALTDLSSTAFSHHVKRDVLGNITAIGNASGVPTATETYGYDPLYRLSSVKNPAGTALEAYTYNKTGDRLSKTGPGILTGAYSYATGTHHLTGIGSTTRTVDARGNTTASALASGAYAFGYNQRNRLSSVQKDGTTVGTYVLNALGQRVQKTVGSTVTRFDYDEASQLLAESTGTTTRDYVWLGNLPVGIVDRTGTSTSVAFIHADDLGTPRVVTSATGVVLWQWPYASNPFGEMPPTSATGYVLNLRFPGQYFDTENGLNYNISRDYEAATGRYMESDPIGLDGGMTTYGYVDQNPFGSVDPLGLQAVCLACHNGALPGFPGPVPMPPPAQSLPAPGAGSASDTGEGVGDVTKPGTCPPDKPCPPCRTVSGMIIPVGTIAYRLDILPDNVRQHGIYGSHYNLYKANQAPRNSARPCKCFWQPIGAVSASEPVFGSIPIENFAE